MKRGTSTKYGSTRTTTSGNVEREDAQPNESLVRKRTTGPPALKPTAPPPVRSSQGRWGQVGNRGRPWSRPANQWNQSSSRPAMGSNSTEPFQNRPPRLHSTGGMSSSSENAPPRAPVRCYEDSQFPPRHAKRQKTSHNSMESARRGTPPPWQHPNPSHAPPLPYRTPCVAPRAPPPTQHLPTPSASASPCSPYTFNPSHSVVPVPPLPSRALGQSPTVAPVPRPAIPHPNNLHQPSAMAHIPSTPMPIQLPSAALTGLNQIGIFPVPKEQLGSLISPPPAAVLVGQSPDAAILDLEINMSLVPISQMAPLAAFLAQLTSRPLPAPRPPPVSPQAPVSAVSRWGRSTQTKFVQPAPPQTLPPPPRGVVLPLAAPPPRKAARHPPPPKVAQPTSPPQASISSHPVGLSQPAPSTPPPRSPRPLGGGRSVPTFPPPNHSPVSRIPNPAPIPAPIPAPPPAPAPVPLPHSPSTPARKVKMEPQSTPLFRATPLPPSSAYTRPGEMVIEPRRLVRQACTRFILPNDCHDEYNPSGFHAARIAFLKEKRKELKAKGLDVERKVVVREDGLVLEWTSPVPVWTDTFLPEAGTDLVSAINEISIENARSAARVLTRSKSMSTPTQGRVIVLDHSRAPSPQTASAAPPTQQELPQIEPAPQLATPAPEPEPEPEPGRVDEPEPPPRVVRPSQVIPPNPHPPKRTFKPVHIPRPVPSANVNEAPEVTGDKPNGKSKGVRPATEVPDLPILQEPPQPTPTPSLAPDPISANESTSNSNEDPGLDGELEYVDDEPNVIASLPPPPIEAIASLPPPPIEAIVSLPPPLIEANTSFPPLPVEAIASPPPPPMEALTEQRTSPVFSDANSSMERDIVYEILDSAPKQGAREASPPARIAVLKSEEDEVIDLTLPVTHSDDPPAIGDSFVPLSPKMEVDDGEEGSEGEDDADDALELARQFLLRYMFTFDHDRAQLEEAYSDDSTFSVSIHDDSGGKEASMASTFCTEERPSVKRRLGTLKSPTCQTTTQPARVYRGKQAIVDRLRSLGPHTFLSPRLPHAHPSPIYDIVSYPVFGPPDAVQSPSEHCGELVLASLHSEAVNTTRMSKSVMMDHIVTVDQSFVLRLRSDADVPLKQEDGVSGGNLGVDEEDPWPVVVVSHQMVVRDGPMLRQEDVEEVLPCVLNIKAANAQCD